MNPDMKKSIEEAVAAAIQPLEKRLDRYITRVKKLDRQRNLAMGTATLCLIAAAFSVGYAVKSQEALSDQTQTNRVVVCANARSTALAFHSPQVTETKDGHRRREGKNHYLNRLAAQRETLIASGDLDCPDIKGFDAFEYLRGKAISEIDRILLVEAPHKAHALGVGEEEGVAAPHLLPHDIGPIDSRESGKITGPTTTLAPHSTPTNTEPRVTSHPESTGDQHPIPTGGGHESGHHGGGNRGKSHPLPHPSPSPAPESPPGQKQEPVPTTHTEPTPEATGSGKDESGSEDQEEQPESVPVEPVKPKLLPEVIEPVEELSCGLLGKLVCHE